MEINDMIMIVVGEADSPAMWSCHNLSEPPTEGWSSGIKMGDHEGSRSWAL